MSHASNPVSGDHQSGLHRIIAHLFALSTVLFLIGGAVIVVTQIALLIAGQGTPAREIAEVIGPWAFGTSSVSGLLAFVLTYFRNGADSDGE